MRKLSLVQRMAGLLFPVLLAACNTNGLTPGSTAVNPPWPRPDDTASRVKAAGLELLSAEGTAFHIHSLLRVFYQGQPVQVPANIGIDTNGISALHTHDTSGIVHIESPVKKDFTLAQFFTEWGVPLTNARAWVAGKSVDNAAGIVLTDATAITVVYGEPVPNPIPSNYQYSTP